MKEKEEKELLEKWNKTVSKVSHVIDVVADVFGIDPKLITSRSRTDDVANARAVVQAILRDKGWTFKRISAVFGKGHAAAMHNVKKVDNAREMALAFQEVKQRISQSSD